MLRTARTISPERLLEAYYTGHFPMAEENGRIGFFYFEPRGIVPLDDRFRVRRSLRQIIRRGGYEIRYDHAPREVLEACSRQNVLPTYELWLSPELITMYLELFHMGYLHTVEVWRERVTENGRESVLVGGLYGLALGGAFCGESMFSREAYASQIALVHLVERLRQHGFTLLDAQMATDHLKQFGLYECTQAEYLDMFYEAAQLEVSFL